MSATATFLSEEGFDGVELKGDLSLYQPTEVKAILGDHGLAVLSLTPEDVDLAHPDVKVRTEAEEYYLRLLDFAVAAGFSVVSCHGAVGRVRTLADCEKEYQHFLAAVQRIAARAAQSNISLAMEVLNRYESHLLTTTTQAIEFVTELRTPNVGILLDAYHMNIEETDPYTAILDAGEHLFLFHAADSNRQAVGRGHTDFMALMRALQRISYTGDVIIECTAAGPDPFTPVKGDGWHNEVRQYAAESLRLLTAYRSVT